jgi:DNA (cytosine-5)-methyltransferase 1
VKPRLLDLFCGAGGCSVGYSRAGFGVVGVDKQPMPRYPFEFHQGDALEYLANVDPSTFDAIHASPPCQAFTTAQVIHGREHADLLTPCRELLEQTGLPYVIENVPGAPMRRDLVLCGSMFGLEDMGAGLQRHRWFEFGGPWHPGFLVPPCQHKRQTISVFGHGGHVYHGVESWRRVMGIDWMSRDELAQAIPPDYTEFIGRGLIEHLERAAA